MAKYLTEWKDNGKTYGDSIIAESFEEAEQKAFMMEKDVKVIGKLITEIETHESYMH